jgi:hypothetical protein
MLTDTNITNQTDIIFTVGGVACVRQMGGGHSSAVCLSPSLTIVTPRGIQGILVGHLNYFTSVFEKMYKNSHHGHK